MTRAARYNVLTSESVIPNQTETMTSGYRVVAQPKPNDSGLPAALLQDRTAGELALALLGTDHPSDWLNANVPKLLDEVAKRQILDVMVSTSSCLQLLAPRYSSMRCRLSYKPFLIHSLDTIIPKRFERDVHMSSTQLCNTMESMLDTEGAIEFQLVAFSADHEVMTRLDFEASIFSATRRNNSGEPNMNVSNILESAAASRAI